MEHFPGDMNRNIKLYPWYQAAGSFLPWLPVFFLYFYQYISLAEALRVSAFYYLFVFTLEIPSGYLSDRFGRRRISLLAAVSAVIAYAIFIVASGAYTLIIGQFFLAGFFALKSGSDNSLLYDSLLCLERESEYGEHEAQAEKFSLLSMSAAALLGGAVGLYSLYLAYALALLGAFFSLYLCWQFVEPERDEKAAPFAEQLIISIRYLKKPMLAWLFGFFILEFSLTHVAAEFAQPFISLLKGTWSGVFDGSSLVSGVVVALSMLTGALGASLSMRMLERYGVRNLLIGAIGIQCVIIGAMGLLLHPLILLFVMFRNFPMALAHAPMLQAVAPHIRSAQRATYLSMQSLAGRLGFSVVLFLLSLQTGVDNTGVGNITGSGGDQVMNWPQLAWLLRLSLVIGLLGLSALLISRWLDDSSTEKS